MKITGLITEYNPFHNGHLYHIRKSKEVTGSDYCIALMSGSYVQRGAPAIYDKCGLPQLSQPEPIRRRDAGVLFHRIRDGICLLQHRSVLCPRY